MSYSYQVISTAEEFDAIENEWIGLTNHSDSRVFQTFDWQRLWWKHYGEDSDLHVVLIRESGELIGILPTFIDAYQSFGRPIYRCLRFLGTTIMQPGKADVVGFIAQAGYLDIIARSGYEEKVIESVERYVSVHCSEIHRVIFDEVPEESLLHKVAERLSQHQSENWNISFKEASGCPIIEFPESWDQFLGNLSSNARYQIRRDVKKVYHPKRKKFDLKIIESVEEVAAAYQTLVDYHQKRWNKRGFPGNYANKRRYNFRKDVLIRLFKRGYLQFQVLTPKDQPDNYLALDLLFNYKDKIYLVDRAFNVDADKSSMGFGNILLYSVLKEAMKSQAKAYDFLRGTESYKLRTANHVAQNRQITFDRVPNFSYSKKRLFKSIQLWIEIKRRLNWEVAAMKGQALDKDYFKAVFHILQFFMVRAYKKLKG